MASGSVLSNSTSHPSGFECLKYIEILHPAKQSSQGYLEAVMAISIQHGCKLVKLNPYMGGGRKNKVSEHPGVFLGQQTEAQCSLVGEEHLSTMRVL